MHLKARRRMLIWDTDSSIHANNRSSFYLKYFSVIVGSVSYQYYHQFIMIIIVIIMTPIQSINISVITLQSNSSARYPNFMFPASFLIVLSPKFTIPPLRLLPMGQHRCCLINVFPMSHGHRQTKCTSRSTDHLQHHCR